MNAPHAREFLTLHEIVAAARANLAPGPWSYLIGGTETETTVRRNRQALDSIAFRPRVLRDVSRIDASAACLGLLGVTSLAELGPRHLAAAAPVAPPGALSAFPLLGE